MRLLIGSDAVALTDADEFSDLRAVTTLEPNDLRSALLASSVGVLDEDDRHVWLTPANIMSLAADSRATSTPAWRGGFDAMVRFAISRGWVDDQGRLRAHVEYLGS